MRTYRLWKKYEKLVEAVVRQSVRMTGRDYYELLGVAREAFFTRAVSAYTPSRDDTFRALVKLITWRECRRYCNRFDLPFDPPELLLSNLPSKETCPRLIAGFNDALRLLSAEAREVVHILLDCPDELWKEIHGVPGRSTIRGATRRIAQRRGIKNPQAAFKEIREMLQKETP